MANLQLMKKFLIVGLGNIGSEYSGTRHNIGFEVLDQLVNDLGGTFETQKLGDIAKVKYKGKTLICLKPSTYMNLSGKAVKFWMQEEKIDIAQLLVVTDDLHLDFGTLRLKAKGSDGGHNGLKDLQDKLQTAAYARLRFGIGSTYNKGRQVDYVLGKWKPDELKTLDERLSRAADLICSFVFAGLQQTMNAYNNT